MGRTLTLTILLGVGGCLQTGDVLQRVSDSASGSSEEGSTSAPQPTGSSESTGAPAVCELGWCPTPDAASWQKQLSGALDFTVDPDVMDLKLFGTPVPDIQAFQADGARVICYFDVGLSHVDDGDRDEFPAETWGEFLDGGPDVWLDHRDPIVRSVMADRLGKAAALGCDAVELGQASSFQENTGFPLTRDDQLEYLVMLADEAHSEGLPVGIQDAHSLLDDLLGTFDFAVDRGCLSAGTCDVYEPFIAADKAVYQLEFVEFVDDAEGLAATYCPEAASRSLSTIFKKTGLGSWLYPCP